MGFWVTFEKMMVILFAIAMGFLAKRVGYLDENADRKLTKLVLNVTLPCMILASVMTGDALPELSVVFSALKVTAVFYGVGALFLLAVPRVLGGTPQQKGVWRYAFLFPNTAFIGYPVVEALFGPGAVFYGVILNLPFNLMTFSVAPQLLGGSRRFSWKSLCTPGTIASVSSLIIALGNIRAPAILGSMTGIVGDGTIPLSLLMLGSVLADMQAKEVFKTPRLWLLSAVRLLVMPAALWLVLRLFMADTVVMGIAVIEMSMPVAIAGAMLCMEYDGDIRSMAQAIFLSTMLSMVTIPLVAAVLL